MNPRVVCACHFVVFIISSKLAPPLRCIMAITFALAVPSRGVFASPADSGVFFDRATLVFDAFLGAAIAAGAWPAVCAGCGAMAFARRWIAAQMRFVALLRFSNFFTDFRSSKRI